MLKCWGRSYQNCPPTPSTSRCPGWSAHTYFCFQVRALWSGWQPFFDYANGKRSGEGEHDTSHIDTTLEPLRHLTGFNLTECNVELEPLLGLRWVQSAREEGSMGSAIPPLTRLVNKKLARAVGELSVGLGA